jgi:hypothetical protein
MSNSGVMYRRTVYVFHLGHVLYIILALFVDSNAFSRLAIGNNILQLLSRTWPNEPGRIGLEKDVDVF